MKSVRDIPSKRIWNFLHADTGFRIHMMFSCLLLSAFGICNAVSIWNIGQFVSNVPEINVSVATPQKFHDSLKIVPFVIRGFHDTLDSMAEKVGYNRNDSVSWFESLFGETKLDSLEGELHETRLAPFIENIKWKYFFEKYRRIDMYGVSRVPLVFREYLRLLPLFSCGGKLDRMQPPYIWVSGGMASSKSVVHVDNSNNQHCVLKGSKSFMLIPPYIKVNSPEFGWLVVDGTEEPVPEGFNEAYGEYAALIDTDDIDLDRFPGWKEVPWLRADLNAGDCIYMPAEWFHYVESKPEITVSWHNWFAFPDTWTDECIAEDAGTSISPSQCHYQSDYLTNSTPKIWHPNITSKCDL